MSISCGKCERLFNSVEDARRHKCKVKNPPSILQTQRPVLGEKDNIKTVDLSGFGMKVRKPWWKRLFEGSKDEK